MEKKLIISILATILISQILGAPLERAEFGKDKERAQYGDVKLVSETNILRMRAYLLVIEINHSVKVLNSQLFEHMIAAGVPPPTIQSLRTEFTTKTDKINNNFFKVMDQANTLMDHLYAINNHIVYTPTALPDDMPLLNNYILLLQMSYDNARDNLIVTKEFMKYKVEVELRGLSGTEVDAANAKIAEAESIINTEEARIDQAKAVFDTTSILTKSVLQEFIDLHVSPK